MNSKQAKHDILEAIKSFVNQRPGFDLRNYDSMANYRGDQRPVQKQREIALDLIRWIDWHDESITAEMLLDAAKHNFSGRLSIAYDPETRKCEINYCTGQYFPTEFRLAVVRVLTGLIWDWLRASYDKDSGFRDYAVKWARNEFGSAASKYFG